MIEKNKLLGSLEELEIDTYETEKEAIIEVENCKPSKLFNLIARASSYRILAGCAEEEYPEDANIKEHVYSARNLLTNKALNLASKFETECGCNKKQKKSTNIYLKDMEGTVII
jgi:hypothetical protein